MDAWITADTHFGYTIKDTDGGIERPRDFSEKLFKGLLRSLTPDSTLIHLGDMCYRDDEIWNKRLAELPGKKWLIIGNHDKKSITWYLNSGWDFAGHTISLVAFGKNILFSHIPMMTNNIYAGPKGYSEHRFDMNIHGHFHDFPAEKVKEKEPEVYKILNKKHFLISVEKLNYQPIKLKRIVELFNTGKYYGLDNALNP
jgi:calcineurin-like phosphoesterase family protein